MMRVRHVVRKVRLETENVQKVFWKLSSLYYHGLTGIASNLCLSPKLLDTLLYQASQQVYLHEALDMGQTYSVKFPKI